MVLLTVEVPISRTVTSDFMAWHCVLNNCYLPVDEAEAEWREDNPPTQEEIEASWERVFYAEILSDYITDRDPLQVCIDRVYLPEVLDVRPFIAR